MYLYLTRPVYTPLRPKTMTTSTKTTEQQQQAHKKKKVKAVELDASGTIRWDPGCSGRNGTGPKRRACFIDVNTNRVIPGLHGIMERRFFPPGCTFDGNRRKVWQRAAQSKTKQQRKDQSGKVTLKRAIKQSKGKAAARSGGGGTGGRASLSRGLMQQGFSKHWKPSTVGRFVENQIGAFIKAAKGDVSLLRSWTRVGDQRNIIGKTRAKKGEAPVPKRPVFEHESEFAIEGIRALLNAKLVPIAVQVPVGSTKRRVATRLDCVCKDTINGNKPVVIEIKTGYEGTWKADTERTLNYPLNELPDTIENMAYVQAYAGALLYQDSYALKETPDARVLYIGKSNGATVKRVPDVFKNNREEFSKLLNK